jgi:hypothetical protein
MAESEISKANITDSIGSHAKDAEAEAGFKLGSEAIRLMSNGANCGGQNDSGRSTVGEHSRGRNHGPILYPLPDVDIHVSIGANPGEVRPGTRVQ